MAEEHVQRRLAAIFAADMVGYSRLMEADERGTISRQKIHRSELIDPKTPSGRPKRSWRWSRVSACRAGAGG